MDHVIFSIRVDIMSVQT